MLLHGVEPKLPQTIEREETDKSGTVLKWALNLERLRKEAVEMDKENRSKMEEATANRQEKKFVVGEKAMLKIEVRGKLDPTFELALFPKLSGCEGLST